MQVDLRSLLGSNACKRRYEEIFKDIDVKGKTLLDVCAGEGYFTVRFMIDGGKFAKAIENNKDVRNTIVNQASGFNVDPVVVSEGLEGLENEFYDYVLYLDTHYHSGTKRYLDKIKNKGKILFISSCSREDRLLNDKLEQDLILLFKKVEHICTGAYGRKIFKCSQVKDKANG